MNVYYDVNFWGDRDNQEPLKPITINKPFVWDNIGGFIPAVYVGNEGLVMDICVEISTEAVNSFLEKWQEKAENGDISEVEYEQCSRENPLNIDFSVELKCSGKSLEKNYSCGASYAPILQERRAAQKELEAEEMSDTEEKIAVEEKLAEAYGCDKTKCWHFYRVCFMWNEDDSIAGEEETIIKSGKIESLEIKFISDYKEYAADIFEIKADCKRKTIDIVSPITAELCKMTIHNMEQQQIETNMFPHHNEFEYPNNLAVLYYELEPNLSWHEFRIKDVNKGDSARGLNKNNKSAAACAIIGGSDGPTAVFLASKKADGTKICTASSSMYFEPVESIRWQPIFSRKEREDLRIEMFDLG